MKPPIIVLLILLLANIPTNAIAAPFAYAVGTIQGTPVEPGALVRIDLASGLATRIGVVTDAAVPATVYANIGGLDIDPATGQLYAVDDAADRLIRIDPQTALATVIGPITDGGSPIASISNMGLAFDGAGTLYFVSTSGRRFATMDITSGALSSIVTGGAAPNTSGLAIGPGGFFGVTPGATDQLISINPVDGVSTPIGAGLGINVSNLLGLEFDGDGVLWGVEKTSGANPTALFTVDTVSGLASVGSTVMLEGSGTLVNELASLAVFAGAGSPSPARVPMPAAFLVILAGLLASSAGRRGGQSGSA